MRRDLPTGTVTFLFTDIEGSTRLLHQLGPEAYAEALAEHRRLLRDVFARHGGVEVDTQGDAFFIANATAAGAAAAAVQGHEALANGPIRVRMGLHTGTPTVTTEGYVGADVHRGARIAALAHGGQVLVSEATQALLPPTLAVADLGRHRVKDFDDAPRVYQLGTGGFPPLRTPGAIDLPTPVTRFVGREHELFDAVSTWLDRDPRILTIVGPGGTGKTRFTIELARLLAEDADGGTVFVALASLRDPTLVVPAVAERLGATSPDVPGVAARVGERQTHVVLDNVEQLLPDAATAIAEMVAAVPRLRLLVTTREPLRVSGEVEVDLPPLAEEEAVELFLERARAVRPDIADSAAVHDLIRGLDGLPLALELAAARVKLLAPEQLLERLSRRLELLQGSRDADERHATLRATIGWSYDLLDDTERTVFANLAVFRSGFTLETAEEVCDAELDTLASLLDKSLLRRRTDPDGTDRLWMLETIREFAEGCLHDQPDAEALMQRRHAERVLERAQSAHLSSEDQGRSDPDYESMLIERDEIRGALDWAVHHDRELAAEIVIALETLWATSGAAEGLHFANVLLDDADSLSRPSQARLLRFQGGMVFLSGEPERGLTLYDESLELFRALGDDDNVVALLARVAAGAVSKRSADESRHLVAEVRALNDAVGNPIVEPQMLSTLAFVHYREGDLETALDLYRRSVAEATTSGFSMWALWTLDSQLEVELQLELLDDAERTGREALALATRLDDWRLARSLLVGLALVALRRAEPERAGALWGPVLEAEHDTPLLRLWPEFEAFSSPLAMCTDARFLAAVTEGRARSLEQAVAIALDGDQTVP
jgi:predicted ATPase/class 3 adenylate cyclase